MLGLFSYAGVCDATCYRKHLKIKKIQKAYARSNKLNAYAIGLKMSLTNSTHLALLATPSVFVEGISEIPSVFFDGPLLLLNPAIATATTMAMAARMTISFFINKCLKITDWNI
jgi:hypothetical protein